MRSSNIPYNPAIDHVRGVAALLIVYFHAHTFLLPEFQGAPFVWPRASVLYALLVEGHTAVALFMVLSGFIFTAIALDRRIGYLSFQFNRFLRIYPLMVAILLFAIALRPEMFHFRPFVGSLLFPFNIQEHELIAPLNIEPWTAIFWTLSPEFQFYLIFPLLIAAVNRGGARVLVVLVAAVLCARLYLSQWHDMWHFTYWTIGGRIDQFLIGMGAAVLWRRGHQLTGARKLLPVAIAAVLLILWAFNHAGGAAVHARWKVAWPTVEASMWAVFILCYLDFATCLPKLVSSALVKVGECSFSVYLLHWPIESLTYHKVAWLASPLVALGVPPIATVLIATTLFFVPATLLVSLTTYRLIERPFLSMRVRYLRDKAVAGPVETPWSKTWLLPLVRLTQSSPSMPPVSSTPSGPMETRQP